MGRSQRTEDPTSDRMDAIRKKMQTMKVETDDLYKKISDMEDFIKETNKESDKFDADVRDSSKKVTKQETGLEETLEKLQQSASKMREAGQHRPQAGQHVQGRRQDCEGNERMGKQNYE